MSVSTATPAELVDMIGSPSTIRGGVKDAMARVAKTVNRILERDGYQPIKPGRVYDIWGGEASPRYWEMDALREVAGAAREARNEFKRFEARLARVEALLVQDEEFMRPHADALDVVTRSPHRAVDRGRGGR